MASVGFSRRGRAPHLSLYCAALLLVGSPSGVHAKCSNISIGASPLDEALLALARQTGTDIATTETGLRSIRVKPVSGCLTVSMALDRLLRGSDFRAVAAGLGGYRVVRAPRQRSIAARPRPQPESVGETADIIVTGTKQQVPLLRFPGSVNVIAGSDLESGLRHAANLDDLADASPIMQKTELGPGRNKLFVRGISDSSFNGPTQATATIYFGDVQLNHSGPEPAIQLVDMKRVEILEGPQETLYGAGAISGIIRLAPNPVELDRISAFASGAGTVTAGGSPGFDASAMLNLPIAKDEIGLRLVGYRTREGGYIDDSLRGLANVNSTDTVGGRAALHIEPGNGWSVEGGVLAQRIDARDSGYAEIIAGPQNRRSFLAQPYSSAITLWRGVIQKEWDSGLELVSATGLVRTDGTDTWDATRLFPWLGPTIYQVTSDGLQLSHETHITRTVGGVSWVAGVSLLYDRNSQSRVIGSPANPFEIIGVRNTTRSASAFGEVTFPLTHSFSVTAGARATISQTQGEPTLTPRAEPPERGFPLHRVQPAIAFSWLLAPRLAMFGRFQTGYRTGGIAVAPGIGRIANFLPDSIKVGELGLRLERHGSRGLAFSTAFSIARWQDIQADLYNRRAQLYTDNIGDATLIAVEGAGDWIPIDGLRASLAFLWTYNRTDGAMAGTSPEQNRHLPNTPPFSGNLGVDYQWSRGRDQNFSVGTTIRYVGRSVLGSGSFLDLSQGDYFSLGTAATWRWRMLEASINVDNLTNEDERKFALGNPLTFGFREQYVRLRPRSIRFGLAVHW